MAHTSPRFTLGIDFGSTSLRAFLWDPMTNSRIIIKNKPKKYISTRFERGDFSTRGYPFDTGPIYLDEIVDPERDSISLKYGFYVLAGASDDILEQYLLVQPLLDQRRDPIFLVRLRLGLITLFTRLREHVLNTCKSLHVIANIGLSIPSQWDLDFEDVYRGIVSEVFDFPSSSISFVTETEAFAQYLCREDHLRRLIGHQPSWVGYDMLLFLDFGGHNMVINSPADDSMGWLVNTNTKNTSLFHVRYGGHEIPSIYRSDRSEGAGGGSEQWEYNVAEMAARWIHRAKKRDLSRSEMQALLDDFNRRKGGLGPDQDADLWFEGPGDLQILLDQENLTECFDAALRPPLLLAESKIRKLSSLSGVIPRVIVTGGTSRHEGLQHRLQNLCHVNGILEPIFTDELDVTFDSVKLAKGTAYAVADTLSVADFMDRGAAIGLQVLDRGTSRNNNPENLWSNEARFLTSKERTTTAWRFFTGKDEMKLVCDPFFEGLSHVKKALYFNECYDILYLGTPSRGYWYITVAVLTDGDGDFLTLERDFRPSKGRNHRPAARRHIDSHKIPVHFDQGSNCVSFGRNGGEPVEELTKRLTAYEQLISSRASQRTDASSRKSGSRVPTRRSKGLSSIKTHKTKQRKIESKSIRPEPRGRRQTGSSEHRVVEPGQPDECRYTTSSFACMPEASASDAHSPTSAAGSNDGEDVPREFSENYTNLSAVSRSALLLAQRGRGQMERHDRLP